MKVIQLYEMILVRHGLMVVGLPYSGKTSCIKVLQGALTLLNERNQMNENKTKILSIQTLSSIFSANTAISFMENIKGHSTTLAIP